MSEAPFHFRGFLSPNYTQVPDELFDQLLPKLTEVELKVLLYIIRRTFGFKRDSDNISLSQMVNGLTTKDGRRLDHGAGLSKSGVAKALRGLVSKNIIVPTRRTSQVHGDQPTNYRLNIIGHNTVPPVGGTGNISEETGAQRRPPVSTGVHTPRVHGHAQGVSTGVHTQYTVRQDTESVERSNVGNAEKTSDADRTLTGPSDGVGFIRVGDVLSPAAQRAYETYKRIRTAHPDAAPPQLPATKKRHPAEGLTDDQVGFARVLEEDMTHVLGSPKQNGGFYRVLSLDAFRQDYEDLIREALSLTRAGDVPRGTIGNRSGYFTKILRAKAADRRIALPIRASRR